jgi:DNA-binding response OmpR family regulator
VNGVRILLVEDEKYLADALAGILKKNKYAVDTVYDGEDGLDYALSNVYDVILLDIMLPKRDGLSVLREFRKENKTTPVIMLTARGEIPDKIAGLDTGADDYMPKPFNTDELLARIRAVGRRKNEIISENMELTFGDITLSTALLRLASATDTVTLTQKECELTEYFIRNQSIILSKERIIEKVWGYDSEAEDNHVEVYISFLRKKLAHIKSAAVIITIRGAGYKLCSKD